MCIAQARGAKRRRVGSAHAEGLREPTPCDFEVVKCLGKGSYGQVVLVKHREDDREKTYAMKVLDKEEMVQRQQVEHTMAEKRILQRISHPFIVSLHFAFQTSKKLHLVLDYCAGGELLFHLGREHTFSEGRARFYAAEITLALQCLHRMLIIYRDLKPENILLDAHGHIKLVDFGLSKEGVADDYSAKTLCGTPEYCAPEVVAMKGSGRAADWYALGAIVFEMLTGLPPFFSDDSAAILAAKKEGRLDIPGSVSPVAGGFIRGLLATDPARRLGGGEGGGEEVRAHSFFGEVNFDALERHEVTPPFRPEVAGGEDVSNFDQELLDLPVSGSMCECSVVGDRADNRCFDGYAFVR